jgi:hypothetical protein
MIVEQFELRRQSGDLIYTFRRKLGPDGQSGYQRTDRDLWIIFKPDLGWVSWDDDSKSVTGIPWNVLPQNQSTDCPPEGDWISKKGTKSYVYLLVYV